MFKRIRQAFKKRRLVIKEESDGSIWVLARMPYKRRCVWVRGYVNPPRGTDQ